MQKHTLFFDLDGTIAEPFEALGSSLRYAFDRLSLGELTDDTLRKLIGPPFYESLKDQFGFSPDQIQRVIDVYREHHATEGLALYEPYPNSKDVIAELSKKYDLFLATSKPQLYAEKVISAFEMKPYFRGIYGPELDGTRSNKTDLLRHLIVEEQLNPEMCIMIGDRKHDIIAGKNIKALTIGVLWGYGTQEEINHHQPDAISADFLNLGSDIEKLL